MQVDATPITSTADDDHSGKLSTISTNRVSVGFAAIVEEDGDQSDKEDESSMSDVEAILDGGRGIIHNKDKDRPAKRTSFAPDPVHWRKTTESVTRKMSPPDRSSTDQYQSEESSGIMSAVRRLTNVLSSMVLSDLRASDFTQSGTKPANNAMGASAPPQYGAGRTTIFSRGSVNSSMDYSTEGSAVQTTLHDGHAREKSCLPKMYYDGLKNMIAHPVWRSLNSMFIFVMLFGSQMQDLWIPKLWDTGCDVLFTMAFAIASFDIIFRSIIDPLYFSARCRVEHPLDQSRTRRFSWLAHCNEYTGCNFGIGSFLFWCDVVGTLTFLYEISYINPMKKSQLQHVITLRGSVPVGGLSNLNMTGMVPYQWELLIVVGRVARMARFIRTSFIVTVANNLNCLQYLHPYYWQRRVCPNWDNVRISKGQDLSGSLMSSTRSTQSPDTCEEEDEFPTKVKMGFIKMLTTTFGGSRASEVQSETNASEKTGKLSERLRFGNISRESCSHVGTAMRELTGQRVAMGVILAVLLSVLFSYREPDATRGMTMMQLHGQTKYPAFADKALDIARSSVVPLLYSYTRVNDTGMVLSRTYDIDHELLDLREREILNITVHSNITYTTGLFDNRRGVYEDAKVELFTTCFILLIWIVGVTAFAGPVMTLVVQPIERMVELLAMLMKDPLGYQNTAEYRQFMQKDQEVAEKSNWDTEVLKGMETTFLMNTILRIGSLMQVGFGSAGTEIIRNNLERGRHKDVLFLNKKGTTVSCIFLFCDIRSFTDCTECLQEEVFVFTNKIAAVVHSITHSLGGSANKNIGDAFLVSWLLDDSPPEEDDDGIISSHSDRLYANSNQADKALLAVVKISAALHFDSYYIDGMKKEPKDRLLAKLSKRPGPLVQMGFGLHAGKAVQGAIGSTRKLDATYISESVEQSEFLESSTKQYGVPVLMSDAFYNLLDSVNKRRCRKVDQLLKLDDYEVGLSDPSEIIDSADKMELYTFDMDIEALFRPASNNDGENSSASSIDLELSNSRGSLRRSSMSRMPHTKRLGFSTRDLLRRNSSNLDSDTAPQPETPVTTSLAPRELVLPTGLVEYSDRCWLEQDIKKIRERYVSSGIFFSMFHDGLNSYYSRDWTHAKQCFETVMSQIDDGPSSYFLSNIDEHDGKPPKDFLGYGLM
eukprot:g12334.t1 g12334   contig6:1719012-1722497(-)